MKFDKTSQKHILMTGASGGIGSALALDYAKPGRVLSFSARSEASIAPVVEKCRNKGADVFVDYLDVRKFDELRDWIKRRDDECPIDLAIACAGVSVSARLENKVPSIPEHPDDMLRVLDVNMSAASVFLDTVFRRMLIRKNGQIVVFGSIASYYPLPSSPAYCASKSAIRTYALAMRNIALNKGIKINVISPGYVDTPMSNRLIGSQPFRWSAEKAAYKITKALRRNVADYAFPIPLVAGLLALRLLPEPIARFFLKSFHYEVMPDSESAFYNMREE